MFTESRIYVKKFVSALYLKNIDEIPFSGVEFENAILYMKKYLEENLDKELFIKIEDLFERTPVQGHYENLRDMVMTLNGESVKFSKVSNPYWKRVSIEFNTSKEAERILNDNSILKIDKEIIQKSVDVFCQHGGISNEL